MLLAAAAIIYLVYYIKPGEIIRVLVNADVNLLFAVILLGIINLFLQFYKWKFICNKNLQEYNNRKILKSLFAGFSAGFITPMRLGEYFGRYAAISNLSFTRTVYAVIVDKLSLLFIEIAFGGALAIYFIYKYYTFGYELFFACCVVYLISLCFFVLINFNNVFMPDKIRNIFIKNGKLKNIYEKYTALKSTDSSIKYKMVLLSGVQYLCFITQYALLICSYEGRSEFTTYILAAGFLFFVKNFVSFLTPGELGTREGVSLFTMSLISVSSSAAFNAAFSLFVINILIPSFIGLFFMVAKDDN